MYGNSNAFFGLTANTEGDMIIAWTFTGAVYCWVLEDHWKIKNLFTGHSKKVSDLRWGSHGQLLFSCSED